MCNPIEPANPTFHLPCANEESPPNASMPLPLPISPPPLAAPVSLSDKCVTQKTVPPLFPSIFPVSNPEEKAPLPSEELNPAAAQPQQALKDNHQSKLEELEGKVSPDALKSFMAYLANKEIPLINNQNAIDLLLLSKEHGEGSLYMHCLKHFLNFKHSKLDQIDKHNLSKEQNDLLSLLIEAKQNEMAISEGAGGIACMKMDCDKEAQWKCLTKLHAFMPITHLNCREIENLDFLLPFLQSNKNLIHLDMGTSYKIGDKELEKIALHLPALKSFSIHDAKITQVPEPISLHVEYLDCSYCSELIALHAPLATEVGCDDCEALTTLHAPLATSVDCNRCKDLLSLDLPLATRVCCFGCKALTTLHAPLATWIYCGDCKALATLHAPLTTHVNCNGCEALTTLSVPAATEVDCRNCKPLTTLNAPVAITVKCSFCDSLTTLNTPVAIMVDCTNCDSLTTLNAPVATMVDCAYCPKLTTLHAPKALSIGRHCEFPAMTTEARLKTFTSLRKNIYMSYYANASDPDFVEHLSNGVTLIAGQQSLLNHERSFGEWLLKASGLVIPAFFGSDAEELRVKRKIESCLEKLLILAYAKGFEEKNLKWFKDLKKLNSPQQQMKRIIWLGALLACSVPGKNPLADPNVLSAIGNLTNPLLQREMTQILLSMYEEETLQATTWMDLSKKLTKHQVLASLMLSKTQLGKEDIEVLLKSLQPAYYKDRAILTPILEMLCLLVLQRESHEHLLKLLLKAPKKKNREKNAAFKERLIQHRKGQAHWMIACRDLLLFGKSDVLLDLANGDDLLEKHKVVCQDFFGIKKELAPQFSETFASKRYPNALPTYAARLQTLPENEKTLVIKALGTFVNALLEGSFPDIRYDLAVNPHLDQIFRDKPALLEKWKAPLEIRLSDEIVPQSPSVDAHAIIKHLMANAINDHHLGVDQDAMYPTLVKILTPDNFNAIATSLTELQEALHNLSGSLDVKKRDRLAIEIDCLKALDPRTEAPSRISILRSLSKKLELAGALDFKNDIVGMLKAIQPSKMTRPQKIESTDSWEDLILMGTEVNNSCQRIEGNPNLNKCLLAYILDGKNKPIIVRDAEGKIAARSVLRILWNAEQQCPVLFMERVYTRTSDPSLPHLIRRGCEKKAAEMRLPLVASPQDFPTAAAYGGTLLALGGPAPFEYVDALSGVKENRVFAISNSRLLYKPGIVFPSRPE